MKLLVASGNANKVKEIKEIFSDYDFEILSLKDIYDEIPDIPETGNSFIENALQKARWLNKKQACWVISDDSGLVVDALNGEPGIYSARYAGEPSDSEKNMDKLLTNLKNIEDNKRTAHFACAIALISPEGKEYTYEGKCKGSIIREKSGTKGFGYDPIFVPNGYDKTFAELGKEIKNKISHRAVALQYVKEDLANIIK